MEVKLKAAIAVAALFGATTVGEFVVISQLRVQVATQQSEDVAHHQAVVKAEAHAMKDFLSAKQPTQHL